MKFTACHRYARISPRKTRYVVDLIRGKQVNQAIEILKLNTHRAAFMVLRVLKSAVANASQNPKVDVNSLVVSQVFVDGGPIIKRYRPGPMGRSMRIRKRTCHINFVLVGEEATGKKRAREKRIENKE